MEIYGEQKIFCKISMPNNELYFSFISVQQTALSLNFHCPLITCTHLPVVAYAQADEISIVHNVVMRQSGSFGLSSCSLKIIKTKTK